LAASIFPTSGRYHLAGDDVSHMSETALAEVRNRRIGFVFQQFNLLASMTAWQNVELPLAYAGVPRSERKERAMEALSRVGLAGRVQHRPGELSGGQQTARCSGPGPSHRGPTSFWRTSQPATSTPFRRPTCCA